MINPGDIIGYYQIHPMYWPDTEEWLLSVDAKKVGEDAYLVYKFLFVKEPKLLELQSEQDH